MSSYALLLRSSYFGVRADIDASNTQSELGKKIAEANVDPLIQEAKSKNTQDMHTAEENHPGITETEKKEKKKVHDLEANAQPTG